MYKSPGEALLAVLVKTAKRFRDERKLTNHYRSVGVIIDPGSQNLVHSLVGSTDSHSDSNLRQELINEEQTFFHKLQMFSVMR